MLIPVRNKFLQELWMLFSICSALFVEASSSEQCDKCNSLNFPQPQQEEFLVPPVWTNK